MAYRAPGRHQSEHIVKELKVLLVEDSRTYALALSRRLEAELHLPIVVCQSLNELHEVVTPCPHHPIGAKGVGESPNVGGVPCFANAVNDAFKFLGSTHIPMPHDHWRTWMAADKLGLHG